MKIAVICRSDSNGGAAIASRRLAEALAEQGQQVALVCADARSGYSFIEKTHYPLRAPLAFLGERLEVALGNGFSRKNLWKVDTGTFGLPLWKTKAVNEADAVILNWTNQGFLSLKGIEKICLTGKRVIWTMHDMWPFTGVCHHASGCRHFTAREGNQCRKCPLLGGRSALSHRVWQKKREIYGETDITFVAVSNWLAGEAGESQLLQGRETAVIHNPFRPLDGERKDSRRKRRILFSAATIDNWIKGLDDFKKALGILKERYPDMASDAEIVLAGSVKNPAATEGFPLPTDYRGRVDGEEALAELYRGCDVVVNASQFENLPGTLIEGQAYGAVPVSFDRGGQSDIISHLSTGYIAHRDGDPEARAGALADGMAWALTQGDETRKLMQASVREKFAYEQVARQYLSILGGGKEFPT